VSLSKFTVRCVVGLVALAMLGLVGVGCGGGSSSGGSTSGSSGETGSTGEATSSESGDAVAAAEALTQKYLTPQPDTWEGPSSSPKPKPGMKIAVISSGQVAEGAKRLTSGATEAVKAIGWESTFCDGKGEPSTQEQCTDVAIQEGVDGIIWSAIDPAAVGSAVDAARKAGIPIVTTYDYGGGDTKPPPGVIADVSSDQCIAGEVAASYAIANSSDGKPKVAMVTGREFPIVQVREECSRKTFEEAGADIVNSQEIRAAEIATKGPSMASALLSRYPAGELEYIWAPYDAAALFLANGVESSGREDVRITGFDANVPNLEMIAEGGPEAATVGSQLEWAGWGAVDELNRSFDGAPTDVSYGVPIQLYTEENAAKPKPPIDYQSEFKKLWGVG
jgi:ribose transport system substrate-binding protein